MNQWIQIKESTPLSLSLVALACCRRNMRILLVGRCRFAATINSAFVVLSMMVGGVAHAQQRQNNSELSLKPRTFQALDGGGQNLLFLGEQELWLLQKARSASAYGHKKVDIHVSTFQGLDVNTVLVLTTEGVLWLDHAPFGTKVPPKAESIDTQVWTFQALDAQNVVVLARDGTVWLEHAPFGHYPPNRDQIDLHAKAFQALDTAHILVVGSDGKLWLEQPPFGNNPPSKRTQIDFDVFKFQQPDLSSSIFVLGADGNLWLEHPPFGKVLPPKRQQIDGNVRAFEATNILDFVWVLDNDYKLWLEQGPFGKVPPTNRKEVDDNVLFFQPLDIQHALVLGTDAKLWLEQAPFGKVPPNRQEVAQNVQIFPLPGGPYMQSCGNPVWNGGILTAFCNDYFGNPFPSMLAYADGCTGVINNVNGQLRCVQWQNGVGSRDHAFSEIISLTSWDDKKGKHKLWTIDQPNVMEEKTPYKDIRFQPGDVVTINANGCVQTGGMGATWKSYVNPQGSDAWRYYSGTIYIPNVIPQGANGYPRIGGFLNKPTPIPRNPNPKVTEDVFLNLGYQDDNWADNGYYNHDDGDCVGCPAQCKGVGPAWVTIEVTTPKTTPTSPGSSNSLCDNCPTLPPGAKPFDEIWDSNNNDMNGLPFNPYWAYQIQRLNQGTAYSNDINPDFLGICGPAFYLYSHDTPINTDILKSICTSQSPTADLSTSIIQGWLGYCSGDPIPGHLEWYISTVTGTLSWDGFSGPAAFPNDFGLDDDDFNFRLGTQAPLAAANGGSLGLEFRADESIDWFISDFWRGVRNDGVNGNDAGVRSLVDGKFCVVTGLLGIDGVHGGVTELHPVYSMAILSRVTPKDGGIDETWEIFLTNTGVGGGCSTNAQHQWPGVTDASGNTWYFISLPMPGEASASNLVAHDLHVSNPGFNNISGAQAGTFVENQFGSWNCLGFQLQNGDSIDGSVTIHYNTSSDDRAPQVRPAPLVLREPVKEGVSWSDVMQKVNPAIKQKLEQVRPPLSTVRAPSRPHSVRLTLDSSPATAEKVQALITQARRHPPQRARVVPNPSLQSRITKVEQTIRDIVGGSPTPIREATPPSVTSTLPPRKLRPKEATSPNAAPTLPPSGG